MTSEVLISPTKEEIEKLEEDPEKFQHFLSLFKDWLRHQTHLPQTFNTSLLALYLRSCKLDLSKTQRKFEAFCYLPLTFKKVYGNRMATFESDLEIMNSVYVISLSQLTAEGYRIGIVKAVDFEMYDNVVMMRTFGIFADFLMHHDTFHTGQIFVFDNQNTRADNYGKIFTPVLFHMMKVILEAYPARIKQIILLSCHPLLERAVNLFKTTLPDKLKNRVHFLEKCNDLHRYIPAELLPSDYNGTQASLAELNEGWKRHLLENRDFFKKVEEMRPTGPIPKYIKMHDDNLGINGSFRKLSID